MQMCVALTAQHPRRMICQLMYIHVRMIGKNAREPYSIDERASPTCAIAQTFIHPPKTMAVKNPHHTA